jgi:hypothetical protein
MYDAASSKLAPIVIHCIRTPSIGLLTVLLHAMHMVRSNEGTPPARLLSELSSESERLTFLLDPPGIFGSVIYSAFRVHGPTRDGLWRVLDNSWLRQSEGKIEGGVVSRAAVVRKRGC